MSDSLALDSSRVQQKQQPASVPRSGFGAFVSSVLNSLILLRPTLASDSNPVAYRYPPI